MVRRSIDPALRVAVRAAVVILAAISAAVPTAVIGASEPDPDPHHVAAASALETLSLADRASQVVMTSVPGSSLRPADADRLRSIRPGGVIVFADNYRSRAQVARWLRRVQVAARDGDGARPRALVAVDQEGGVVRRMADLPPTRSHPQLGIVDRIATTRSQARATGVALRRLGMHMDLAPVADVDRGPRHVMRARSFGSRPPLVARHVVAFARGLGDARVAASVKHFPGFGGASVNSDDARATIGRTRSQLDADIVPFRAAIDAGVDSIMVSHGIYRAIDRRRPATTSPAIYRMLREEFGFDGVAITDSLHAAGFGAAARTTVARGCVEVVVAGADIALLTGTLVDAARCRAQLVEAVRDRRLPIERLDEAALRVLRLKSRLGLLADSSVSTTDRP